MGSRGRNGNSREVWEFKESLKLTKLQKQVLVGKILGDGCLVQTITGRSHRLQIEQCINQKEYVYWIASIFNEWIFSEPRLVKAHNSFMFRTVSHPQITEFHKIFYSNGIKLVPKNIGELMVHPISLAVWIMDDGGLSTSKKAVTISTHNFSREDNQLLIECLKNNFRLQVNLNWDGKGYRLYIPVKEIPRLKELVSSYVLPVMKYKLPLTP
ncbi:MAG: LAGLIDADG endonuclease [Candidatus Moranbacteria bacterium]|nr:LAGLIDADG endonuclease [Candidatus Moranbacteria bacterium]